MQPDRPVAQLDRVDLQSARAERRLDRSGDDLEGAAGAGRHLAGLHVVERVMRRAAQFAVLHVALAERGEEMAAGVRDSERLAIADPDRERAVRRVLDDRHLRFSERVDRDQLVLFLR